MQGRFQSTVWDTIREAGRGERAALDDFVARYRPPVVGFLRSRGLSAEDAEDLAQEVFLLIVQDRLLSRAQEGGGRFRSFLLAIVMNVLRNSARIRDALKRGGGRRALPLDEVDLSGSAAEDAEFDREWVHHLVTLSLATLKAAEPALHALLELRAEAGLSYGAIAERLRLTEKQVEHQLARARTRLGDLIRLEIVASCASQDAVEAELAYLSRFLEPPGA